MFGFDQNTQFGYDPMKKKQQQPDANFSSVAVTETPTVSTAPSYQIGQQQDQSFQLPSKAQQKYDAPIDDESALFKGLTKGDEQKLLQLAGGNQYKAMDMYPTLLQQKQDYLFLKDRKNKVTENIYNAQQSNDKETIKSAQSLAKIAQFVDYIREDALKKGSVGVSQMDDQAIIDKVFGSSPIGKENASKYMSQYMNSSIDLPTTVDRILGKPEAEKETTIGGSILGGLNDSAQGTAKLGEMGGNFLGEQIVKLIGKAQGKSDEEIQSMVDKGYKASDQYGVDSFVNQFNDNVGANKESAAYGISKAVGDIAQTVAPAGISGKIDNLGGIVGKGLSRVIPTTEKLGIVGKGLKIAGQGALDTIKYDAIANQQLASPKEIALGAGMNVAGAAIGAGIQKGAKAISNKLQLSGLLNPKKLEYVSNALKQTGDDIDNVSNWMQERGVAGSKTQIVSKLDTEAKKTFDAVRSAIDQADGLVTPIKDKSVDGALRELIKVTKGVNSPEKQAVYKELQSLLVKSKNTGLSLKEIQKVKESMDNVLDLYSVAGDVKSGIQKADMAQLRSNIRKLLETNVKKTTGVDIGILNRDTAVAKQLSSSIKYKDKTDAIREMLSPFAPSAIGGVAGYSQGDNIQDKLKYAALGAIVGALTKSTRIKTRIGVPIMKGIEKGIEKGGLIRRGASSIISTKSN